VRGIGNVLKDPVPVELLTAVRKALTGKTLLNRELAMRLIRRLAEDVSTERLGPSTPEPPSTEPAGKNGWRTAVVRLDAGLPCNYRTFTGKE
jgi:DNA-binding NarL/FixJ family response regulator